MNKTYVYVGIALAVLVVLLFLFKVEFSMITGTTNPDSRIMSVTAKGDLVLSDNTVQNINDYIAGMAKNISVLQTQMKDANTAIGKEISDRKADTTYCLKEINGVSTTMKDDYVRYNDEMQIAGTYGCGEYKNLSTYKKGNGGDVANSAPLGANDPNPRFIIRKRCGGCAIGAGGSNTTLQVNRGGSQAWGPDSGCKGFVKYNSDGSVKK